MEKFEIIMIGNTGVGKTSMLSALANELDAYNLAGTVALEPTTKEFKVLADQWTEMKKKVESQSPFTTFATAIGATAVDFVEHKFDFKINGKKEATVVFTDTRGGMTGNLDDKLVARVNGAFGVFCVIDASVLMECPESKNDEYNRPDFVKRILNRVYNDGDDVQPRFVVFVLTKCEKYMASSKGRDDLSKKFHKTYDTVVGMLHKTKHQPNIGALAIQTLGCVRFFNLDQDGWPVFRILPQEKLKTKDCAYPLVVLLENVIKALSEGKSLWNRLLQFLHLREDIKKYLGELKRNVREPDFYEEL